ncbi:hypothetical protein [Nocardia asiatica]|uniref:hypothetical protein n=1 Tax=Nocardia asiatica TaxID=209252 RepID=UPI002453CD86|nr:hypothetical protein [Nocardia asiatica]
MPHKRVELDARATYEILLYYTKAYFWYWTPTDGPPDSTPWRSIWMWAGCG